MKKLPIPQTMYEVWYLDNFDTDIESWRSVQAGSYADALRSMESLTQDRRPGQRNTIYYIVTVERIVLARQVNEFDNEGAG